MRTSPWKRSSRSGSARRGCRQELQRDRLVQRQVRRAIDLAHPAAAGEADDAVAIAPAAIPAESGRPRTTRSRRAVAAAAPPPRSRHRRQRAGPRTPGRIVRAPGSPRGMPRIAWGGIVAEISGRARIILSGLALTPGSRLGVYEITARDRRRRDGPGVSRDRHDAGPPGRDQDPAGRVRVRSRPPGAVRARGEDARVAQSSPHRRDLRVREIRRACTPS